MISDVMKDSKGSVLISVLLGLGLAALFKKVCKGDRCIVVRPPDRGDIAKFVYKIEKDCYKYTPYVVPCDGAPAQPRSA